jgi:hypothetical protein
MDGRAVTLESLAGPGGGTAAGATAASVGGFFVFVTFIALRGAELSGGTFRALLLREPRRVRVVVGEYVGLMLIAAGIVALAEVATFVVSLPMASTRDVSTDEWFSIAGLGHAAGDYATVLAGVAGWAVLATALATVFGSAPIALGVGFVWAGPFEHLLENVWAGASQWFPGLVLESLIAGGTDELSLMRAVITAFVYVGIAGAIAIGLSTRRDVTA